MSRTQEPPHPPSISLTTRRITAIPMIVLLYTAAIPFTPTAWLFGDLEGAFLLDQFIAGIALLCALYFQFCVAGISYPVAVSLPNPLAHLSGRGDTYISNGRMGGAKRGSSSDGGDVFAWVYRPQRYWLYAACEAAALGVAAFGGAEYLRRGVVVGVVGALWVLGWTVTPRRRKEWAWEHIKAVWFFIALDVIRDIGFGGGRQRRRR